MASGTYESDHGNRLCCAARAQGRRGIRPVRPDRGCPHGSAPGSRWYRLGFVAVLILATSVTAACGMGDRIPADQVERVLTDHLTGALPNLVPAADLHVFTDSIRDVTPSTKRTWGPFDTPFVIRAPGDLTRPDLTLPAPSGARYHARVSLEFGVGDVVEYGPALADVMRRALKRQISSPEVDLIAGLYRLEVLVDTWRIDHLGVTIEQLLAAEEEGDSARDAAFDAVATSMDTTIPARLLEARAEAMDPPLPETMDWGIYDPIGDGGAHILWAQPAGELAPSCMLLLTSLHRLDSGSVTRTSWGDSATMEMFEELSALLTVDPGASCRRDGETLRLSSAQHEAFGLLGEGFAAIHAPDS